MYSLFLAIAMALTSVNVYSAEPETKKVCVDIKDKEGKPVKDAKGNVKQQCKEVKVHKKLEGTEIPPKK